MVSLDKVLRWAPCSRWRLEVEIPAALRPWLEGRHPLLDACLNGQWEMRCAVVGEQHAELHFSGNGAIELALRLRYAPDGSLDGELDLSAAGMDRCLRRSGLAAMLGGKHEAYLCERKDGQQRMLLRLDYARSGSGEAHCFAFGEALRDRVPEYLQGLLPQEIALLSISALPAP
jgi:hypothetical protein